ncbi:uncharacterized protein FFUJ_12760 [Fusarium fujikuroi IMI 58289]|uniref:DUF7908 domain-containing protein n=1 Tax=Gibberella fujikuroi (strain CBS 195.34 / IMI 58289 / NRRL A-6831) TaxID=1279085 RepID=S0ED50_GIBF5|nr:uncharacterized protein FFUJ_12760 [Fusarium fujikuroi IMI 58289]CCT72866.1 uncharacterized protein FFUJ_12760 [Fusarium fujikuroi IMI 58289]SCO25053.1 uncharacterized protein FFM5_13941 [Fusarium fujikuroi]SCO54095.1 uncharacterized protein FFMR_11642 [Fusarium fujikuroi]
MSYFTSVFGRQTNESKTESVASLIDEEILQLAESISESASVAVELSTEESPVTQSAFQTSFGQTTLVSFTTTGIIEPGGQIVIFLIQLPDDDRKRSINKREVGGFVGDGSPDTCTFASTFNLAQGQLFKNDNPLFYSGEDFKELVNQGMPPSDAITKGFASTGTSLTFQNDDLPNGQAGFCQTSDGQVYITFTSKPPGCTPITLGVHDGMPLRFSRCQNGILSGVDHNSSSSTTTATQETIILSEKATTLSSELVESSNSSLRVTTIQPDLTSSYETPSSIDDVASTTSLVTDDPTSDSSTSDSSSSELAESITVSDSTSPTLATLEAFSVQIMIESVGDIVEEITSIEATTEVSTAADEAAVKTTTTQKLQLQQSTPV